MSARGGHALRAQVVVLLSLAACTFDGAGTLPVVDGPRAFEAAVFPDAPLRDQAADHADGPRLETSPREAAPLDLGPDKPPPCGALGQPCCAGASCSAVSLTCISSTCVALPALDASGQGSGYSGSIQVSLTTTRPNDLIYVAAVLSTDQPVKSVASSPSLTWTGRAKLNYHGAEALVTYFAVAPLPGKVTVTLALDNGSTHWAAAAFAFSGVSPTASFDGAPKTASGNSSSASVAVTTASPGAVILGVLAVGAGYPSLTCGTGFYAIVLSASGSDRATLSEHLFVSGPQSGLAVPFTLGGTAHWGVVAEALRVP